MTPSDADSAIRTYRDGLDAEIALLHQLDQLAVHQQAASATPDLDLLARIGDERDRLTASLLAIEQQVRPLREQLAANRLAAAGRPGFADLVALHRVAGDLAAAIMGKDRASLDALEAAEVRRRTAAQALETGEHTLAAYRRVIAPPLSNAAIVNKHG